MHGTLKLVAFLVGIATVSECYSTTATTDLKLPTFVDSSMVLQREPLQSTIWGWAVFNSTVSVKLTKDHRGESRLYHERLAIANVNDQGLWMVDFPPQPAGTGFKLSITDGKDQVILDDIAFGDVYLCSGQSNMEMSVNGALNATKEIADSKSYPHLRLATVGNAFADTPQFDADSKANYTWSRSGPLAMSNVSESHFSWFSATCYFFGRDLYKSRLSSDDGLVPIGLVASSFGGQKIETFSSPDALADKTCGGTRSYVPNKSAERNLQEELVATSDFQRMSEGFDNVYNASQLWNAMIYPLLPMRFTGVVWYQGEANALDPSSYSCRFPAMIYDWRIKFNLPDLAFLYVQLAGYVSSNRSFCPMRAAQDAALQLPKVGFATAMDIGDPTTVHPLRKQEVGRRLSLVARGIQYKQNNVDYQGPVMKSVQLLNKTFADIHFVPESFYGIHFNGTAGCSSCCQYSPFQVMDATGNWTPATVVSTGNYSIQVQAGSGIILGVRLEWEDYPECALYNNGGGPDSHEGLPAAPFEWCLYPSGQPHWTLKACSTGEPSLLDQERLILHNNR